MHGSDMYTCGTCLHCGHKEDLHEPQTTMKLWLDPYINKIVWSWSW